MQVRGQGLEDVVESHNHDDAYTLKVLECFVWSNTFFQIEDQNS